MIFQLNIPSFSNIDPLVKFGAGTQIPSAELGGVISTLSSVAIYIGAFMMFVWMAWGVFSYIIAQGDKEGLAKARARIRWALLGFLILILAFFVSDFYYGVLEPQNVTIQQLSDARNPVAQPAVGQRQIGDLFGFGNIKNLGQGIGGGSGRLVSLAFMIAGLMVVFYFILGAFDLITSQGDKNAIAAARAKITHAIIGFILLTFLFLVLRFLPEAIGLRDFNIVGP